MQDGANDLDNQQRSLWWPTRHSRARSPMPATNTAVEQGQGFHNNNHIRAILPTPAMAVK